MIGQVIETAPAPRPVRPPLKWAGGKRWLIPHLAPLWRPYRSRRLVEPFAGGLAVSLGLQPEHALCNDINRHVINFYRQVQLGLTGTIRMANDRDLYYEHRDRFNALIRDGEDGSPLAAELFYYLNRTGFNGLCRFNRRGEFNVPFGRYAKIVYKREFASLQAALSDWQLTSVHFSELPITAADFVYADPPYDVEFTSYSSEAFGWRQQVQLAEWLASLDVPVVASNQATARILSLYSSLGFKFTVLDAPRMISCNGDRSKAREMLATRNL